MLKTGLALSLLVAILAVPSLSQAGTITIHGTNPYLSASADLYIPFQPSTSGLVSAGHGLATDSVLLDPAGTSSGYVSMVETFNLSSQLGGGQTVDPSNAKLQITWQDLDFLTQIIPVASATFNYREEVEITFLPNATDPFPSSPHLVLTNANYGAYRADGAGATNDTSVVYVFDLASALGVTAGDFANMNTDQEFGVAFTFRSVISNAGTGSATLLNSSEDMSSIAFVATSIPEPATMSLLAISGLAMLRRKRK